MVEALDTSSLLIADLGVPRVVAFTTLRTGGVSRPPYDSWNMGAHVGDDPAAVAANRDRLATWLLEGNQPRWLEQVHGTHVIAAHEIGFSDEDRQAAVCADAAWTHQPSVPCAVMTADCLPVVFAAADGSKVAVAHAGWRGLAEGVLEATVAAMALAPATLRVWLGPAIGPDAFEVGDDVREAFVDAMGDIAERHFRGVTGTGKWHADIYGLARSRLSALGVTDIRGGDHCTVNESSKFFSYRRDGVTGRMATIAMIKPSA